MRGRPPIGTLTANMIAGVFLSPLPNRLCPTHRVRLETP
jgi:hypothetical protein